MVLDAFVGCDLVRSGASILRRLSFELQVLASMGFILAGAHVLMCCCVQHLLLNTLQGRQRCTATLRSTALCRSPFQMSMGPLQRLQHAEAGVLATPSMPTRLPAGTRRHTTSMASCTLSAGRLPQVLGLHKQSLS
jgi:hypothetical protein